MDADDIAARIDHTVLSPETTPRDARAVVEAAAEHGTNACIPPCFVADVATLAADRDVTLVTVVGFPHGQHAPAAKRFEAERAWKDGADELDCVVNVGRLRAGETDRVREELSEVVASVPIPVKAIIEAPLLTDEEKRRACEAAAAADCAFVKTATGFAEGGATVADVELLSEYLPVKASGGVGSWADAKRLFEAGADRIGASSGVEIVREMRAELDREDVVDGDEGG